MQPSTSSAQAADEGLPGMAGIGDAQMKQATKMMRDNPEIVKQTAQMMASMPDAQLEALVRDMELTFTFVDDC